MGRHISYFYSLKSKFFVCLAFWWCSRCCQCLVEFVAVKLLIWCECVLLLLFCLFLGFSHHKFISLTTSPKEWNYFKIQPNYLIVLKFLNKHFYEFSIIFVNSQLSSVNSRICYCNKINIHCPSRHIIEEENKMLNKIQK